MTTKWPRLHDHDLVTYSARVLLVVSHEALSPPHKFLVNGVQHCATHFHDYCFVHLVADDNTGTDFPLFDSFGGVRH